MNCLLIFEIIWFAGCLFVVGSKIRGYWKGETAKADAANGRKYEPTKSIRFQPVWYIWRLCSGYQWGDHGHSNCFLLYTINVVKIFNLVSSFFEAICSQIF